MKRIQSIDVVRGAVMIIMALDHVRDMIHVDSIADSPTNLSTTSPGLFFTRWITYLCAPTFVFLAGTSAYLSFKRTGDLERSKKFLLKRGLFLVVLEFVVVNFLLFFDVGLHTFLFEVIAAIGMGFIILSFMLGLSPRAIGLTGVLIIVFHNLLPTIFLSDIAKQLFVPTAVPLPFNRVFVMAYPPIPWLGIMLAGYAAGFFFQREQTSRRRLFFAIGALASLLSVIIRFINQYGDPVLWTTQSTKVLTMLSFFNITKYPPSLIFCLATLGVMFLMLAFSDSLNKTIASIISVYGKVPLFYFLLHFLVIHLLLLVILWLQGFSGTQMDFSSGTFGRPKGVRSGLPLWAIYILWAAVVALLYKPCQWFANYKARSHRRWVKYV